MYIAFLIIAIIFLIFERVFSFNFRFENKNIESSTHDFLSTTRVINFINLVLLAIAGFLIYRKDDLSLFLIEKPHFTTDTFGWFSYVFAFFFVVGMLFALVTVFLIYKINNDKDENTFISTFIGKNKDKESLLNLKENLSLDDTKLYTLIKKFERTSIIYIIIYNLTLIFTLYAFSTYILNGKSGWFIFFFIFITGLLINTKDSNNSGVNMSALYNVYSFNSILIGLFNLVIQLIFILNTTPMFYRAIDLKEEIIKEIDKRLNQSDDNDNDNDNANKGQKEIKISPREVKQPSTVEREDITHTAPLDKREELKRKEFFDLDDLDDDK